MTVFDRFSNRLFGMSSVQVEAIIGVGINIASYGGSVLLDLYPSDIPMGMGLDYTTRKTLHKPMRRR